MLFFCVFISTYFNEIECYLVKFDFDYRVVTYKINKNKLKLCILDTLKPVKIFLICVY